MALRGNRFPDHPPSSPQTPIDPVLLQMDTVFNNERDLIGNPHEAEQLLWDAGVWSELPGSKSPSM